jgi:hypothetical protein
VEGDPGTSIDIATQHIDEDRGNLGWGCLLLALVLAAIVAIGGAAFLIERDVDASVDTVASGGGGGSAHLERVTPQGTPADDAASGAESQEAHQAATAGLAVGQGAGGVGNPLNPQLPQQQSSQRQSPTHTPAPQDQVIIVPQEPVHAPPAGPTCDPNDSHSPCYEPPPEDHTPCDPCDPSCPPVPGQYVNCYTPDEPPPHQP